MPRHAKFKEQHTVPGAFVEDRDTVTLRGTCERSGFQHIGRVPPAGALVLTKMVLGAYTTSAGSDTVPGTGSEGPDWCPLSLNSGPTNEDA